MKNEEKYIKKCMEIFENSQVLAVDRETNEPVECGSFDCRKCLFDDRVSISCREVRKEWLNAEYEPHVDWSKVKVDTKVLVSDDNEHWYRRHFAKYKDRKVCTWCQGKTSWTVFSKESADEWQYAKLYEGNEDDNDKINISLRL